MSGLTRNQNNEAVFSNLEMVVSWTGVKVFAVVGTVNPYSTLQYSFTYFMATQML
jgi:hypothetical protein